MAVTLINVFIVPRDREEEFFTNWKKTSTFFANAKSGFIETHLHKNAGVGNETFSFINIARWESAEAWRSSHDAYSPTEYRIPGVKGHPAIFAPCCDMYRDGVVTAGAGFLSMSAEK